MSTPYFLALDVETTGLGHAFDFPFETNADQTIEVAALILDSGLSEVARYESGALRLEGESEAEMSGYVRAMHTRTGLLERARASTFETWEADRQLAALLESHGVGSGRNGLLLLGNSITLDREFLRRDFPHAFNHLHYRSVDVSSFKEIVRLTRPEVVERIDGAKDASDQAHTALHDIEASVAELRTYLDVLGLTLNG